MPELNTVPTRNARLSRNALLAGGGVALTALGLAAGLMWRAPADNAKLASPTPTAAAVAPVDDAPPPVAAVEQPKPAPVPAPTAPRHEAARSTHTATSGGAAAPAHELPTQHVATCSNCGVIEAVRPVQQQGQGSGLGAVAGGVVGGVVGNSMGHGNGRAALTVLGALGGGLAGNEIEKRTRTETVYEVKVRMDDGSLRTLTQRSAPTPGARVAVEGQTLRTLGGKADNGGEPRMMRTSGPGSA
jgi:outer membrane lipoprotein SlyB